MGIIPVGSCSLVNGSINIGRGSRLGAGVGVDELDVLDDGSEDILDGIIVGVRDKVRRDVLSDTRTDVSIDVFTV